MTKTAQTIVAKALVAFVAAAMLFTMFATPAKAATSVEDLQKMINDLMAQIAALQGTTTGGTCVAIPAPLTIGAQNANVTALQNYLIAAGQVIPAGATGYFGTQTQSALAAWQAANGVAPAVGYYGPITAAAMAAKCVPVDTDGDDDNGGSADLEGGAGSITDTELVSGISNEEVGEGAEDVEVAGLEIEADDGSDIEVTAVKLDFDDEGTANNDNDLDEYASEISIWFDGEEVARVDADEFDDDNNYSKTISLDSGVVIRAGETGEIIVAVSGISNLDSASVGDSWDVDFETVRFRDAQGATISETVTEIPVVFTFESFATSADLEFKVSKGDSDINDARSIAVSSTTETDSIEILSFEIELEGNSDVTVDDIAVDFATSTGDLLSDLLTRAELVVDGEVIGSESITTSHNDDGIVIFDNLNWDIEAGDTIEVIVRVDMNELNTGTFGAGATLSASVDPENASWDVEDENGDDLSDADKSGTATSDAHVFYGDGIQVVMSSVSEVDSTIDGDNNDYTTLTIKFDVTAFGEDAYIPNVITNTVASSSLVTTAPSTSEGVGIALNSNDDDINATGTVSVTLTSTADEETNSFKVVDGETETFTAKIIVVNGTGGGLDAASVRAILTGVGFADTDSATSDSVFTSNVTDIKTDYGYIAN